MGRLQDHLYTTFWVAPPMLRTNILEVPRQLVTMLDSSVLPQADSVAETMARVLLFSCSAFLRL